MDKAGTLQSGLSRDEQKFLDKLRERMIAAKVEGGDGYAIMYWSPKGDTVICHRRCEHMPTHHFPAMHKLCGEALDFWQRASRKPIRDETDDDETEREDAPDEGGPEASD